MTARAVLGAVLIQQSREAFARADRVMMATLGTHFEIALEFRPVQHSGAAFALLP